LLAAAQVQFGFSQSRLALSNQISAADILKVHLRASSVFGIPLCIFYEYQPILAIMVKTKLKTRHTASTKHSLTFCHSNETCALIANLPNSAQLQGTPYHSPKLHQGTCSSVGMRQGADRQTDTQMHMSNIHFVSSTTHAKCNEAQMKITTTAAPTKKTGYHANI